jgi:hypothetical protein
MEHVASIFRVEGYSKQEVSIKYVTSAGDLEEAHHRICACVVGRILRHILNNIL